MRKTLFSQPQLMLLTSAVVREDGALLLPNDGDDRLLSKAVTGLLTSRFVSEIAIADPALAWRFQDDQPFGFVISDLGCRAVAAIEASIDVAAAPASKIGRVVNLLHGPEGASLAELRQCTGWQPHTVRSAISTLRKKGMNVRRHRSEARPFYRVEAA